MQLLSLSRLTDEAFPWNLSLDFAQKRRLSQINRDHRDSARHQNKHTHTHKWPRNTLNNIKKMVMISGEKKKRESG